MYQLNLMSEGWKVPVMTYKSMIHGLKEEYSLHRFNVEAGFVIFRTKRERRLLEDVFLGKRWCIA